MTANNKPENSMGRIFIPSFLRRSGIKIRADLCAEQDTSAQSTDGTSNHGSEAAHSNKPQRRLSWKPRSFLNEIVTTPSTRHCDLPADTMGSSEAKKDNVTPTTRTSSEPDKRTLMEGDESEVPSAADDGASTTAIQGSLAQFVCGEDEASGDTGSSSCGGTLTPPSTVAEQMDEDTETSSNAPDATMHAMTPYEVAREYQRRVDRGEVRAPTDQDRANYVNWKRNYMAWMAKKREEEAGE